MLGSPLLKGVYSFSYTPVGIRGMAETPLFMNELVYGLDLRNYATNELRRSKKLNLQWMIDLYDAYPDKKSFFVRSLSSEIGDIDKLARTREFRQEISEGKSPDAIRAAWQPGLAAFKKMRAKCLLYK